MSHPSAVLTQAQLRECLIAALDCVGPASTRIEYRLVGTGAALLHGVPLPAADVDLLFKTRAGLTAFASALSVFACLQQPGWLAESAQYYANFEVKGVEVNLSTVEVDTPLDFIETYGPGPWQRFSWLPCGPHQVPTVALELRLITELYRERRDRYLPLLAYMRAGGCDLAFVARAMQAAGVPPELQAEALQQFASAPGVATA